MNQFRRTNLLLSVALLGVGMSLAGCPKNSSGSCNSQSDCGADAYCYRNACINNTCKNNSECFDGRKCWNSKCVFTICDQNNGGCDINAACQETSEARTCTCNSGFLDYKRGDTAGCCKLSGDSGGREANCTDGIDNDCDGTIDCEDRDCAQDQEACPICNGNSDCLNGKKCWKSKCVLSICAVDHGDCDYNATCDESSGEPVCKCKPGFQGEGKQCVSLCAGNNGGCDANANCDASSGAVVCKCKDGFSGDGYKCSDDCPQVDCSLPKCEGRKCKDAVGTCESYVCSAGSCSHSIFPSTYECRSTVDMCDIAEYCDGLSPECPTDRSNPKDGSCATDWVPWFITIMGQ